jgi:hypothetical protein
MAVAVAVAVAVTGNYKKVDQLVNIGQENINIICLCCYAHFLVPHNTK